MVPFTPTRIRAVVATWPINIACRAGNIWHAVVFGLPKAQVTPALGVLRKGQCSAVGLRGVAASNNRAKFGFGKRCHGHRVGQFLYKQICALI